MRCNMFDSYSILNNEKRNTKKSCELNKSNTNTMIKMWKKYVPFANSCYFFCLLHAFFVFIRRFICMVSHLGLVTDFSNLLYAQVPVNVHWHCIWHVGLILVARARNRGFVLFLRCSFVIIFYHWLVMFPIRL